MSTHHAALLKCPEIRGQVRCYFGARGRPPPPIQAWRQPARRHNTSESDVLEQEMMITHLVGRHVGACSRCKCAMGAPTAARCAASARKLSQLPGLLHCMPYSCSVHVAFLACHTSQRLRQPWCRLSTTMQTNAASLPANGKLVTSNLCAGLIADQHDFVGRCQD